MTMERMVINGRFEVDPLGSEVTDRQTNEVSHLEPRLMKLLYFLVERSGKPVARQTLVKEIWDDYPGGDEGLNQAISVLRKILQDSDKRLIQTLPKTGYCFQGTIDSQQPLQKKRPGKIVFLVPVLILLVLVGWGWGYYQYRKSDRAARKKADHERMVQTFQQDSKGK